MDRLKSVRLPLLLSLGIAGTILALPQTRWIVLNWIDFQRYGQYPEGQEGMTYVGPVAPKNLADAKLLPSGTEFKAAKLWSSTDAQAALEYARQVGTPVAFAQAVRVVPVGSFGGERRRVKGQQEEVKASYSLLKAAAEQGAKADPSNAFFLWNLAAADWNLGDHPGAFEAFHRIQGCSRYEDYNVDAVQQIEGAFSQAHGYRGEQVKLVNVSGLTSPHLARYRTLGKEMLKENPSLTFKLEQMRAALQLAEQGHTAIDMLVGASIAMNVLTSRLSLTGQMDMDDRNRLYRKNALDLESALTKSGIPISQNGPVAIQARMQALVSSIRELIDADVQRERVPPSPLFVSVLTLGLQILASVAALLVIWACYLHFRKGDRRFFRVAATATAWCAFTYVCVGLVFIAVELRVNEKLRGFSNEFVTEGPRIRAAADHRA